MTDVAIKITNLTKSFKIYKNVFLDRLIDLIPFLSAKNIKYFIALDNVNLEIKKGEVVGLIGPNGAGKSTLLKILAGISQQTSGTIEVNGKLTAVLALGLGFNPRFSGRENIKIGGALLGMSSSEMKEKEKWIIEFSELENFIDQPLRSYSSGMKARLSFAVAASVSPDILIIDEALATGDAMFVQKSLGRIHEICKSGATAIFVSHNVDQIRRLCDRVILLEHGKVVKDGEANKVTKYYYDVLHAYAEKQHLMNIDTINDDSFGNKKVVISDMYFQNHCGERVTKCYTGDQLKLVMSYESYEEVQNARIIIHFINKSGVCAYAYQSQHFMNKDSYEITPFLHSFNKAKGEIELFFDPILLTSNMYHVNITIYDENELYSSDSEHLDRLIYKQSHIARLDVMKKGDLNYTLIFEHPIKVKQREL